MHIVSVKATSKGHRVWLQATGAKGPMWAEGATFNVTIGNDAILLTASPTGKRRVSKGKGGIIDLTSKKITQWAQGADSATVVVDGPIITIIRNSGE